MDSYSQNINAVCQILKQRSYYQSALDLFEYDLWQTLPQDGRTFRGEVVVFMVEESKKCLLQPKAAEVVEYFRALPRGAYRTEREFAAARKLIRDYDRTAHVPPSLDAALAKCALECQMIWREALRLSDFDMYKPHMKRLFDLKREAALTQAPDVSPFQTMVDMFDQGLDVNEVCLLLENVKTGIHQLMQCVKPQKKAYAPELFTIIPERARAEKLAAEVMCMTGFDTNKSSFDAILHPICFCIGPRDVRVTINYECDIWTLLCIYLHECGHGRYSYGTDSELVEFSLWGGISGAMHEGIARFYENMIGKSREFVEFAYPHVVKAFPELSRFNPDTVYATLTHVEPSVLRGAADELTYTLHPIIRFEMEKDYFEGRICFDDFREIWNHKYKKYLGVSPKTDAEGILQDISWSSGYLGYFQSYALGNLYGAQFLKKLLSDVPDVYTHIASGDFGPLNGWFQRKVFRYGNQYTSGEIIEKVSGNRLGSSDFIEYLDGKFCGDNGRI